MSQFIAPINNEVREGVDHIQEYKDNLNKLENFVMCMGERDVTVIPRETAHFGFYKENSTDEVEPMPETKAWFFLIFNLMT